MMHRLRPALLDDLGLTAALQELLRQCGSHHPELTVEATLDPLPPLPHEVELAAYRIVQEALTNIVKHAEANRIELVLRTLDREFELRIRDDGRGIERSANGRGYGLIGMRERALAAGGEFHLTTGPGMGTTIHVSLPLTTREVQHER